jgi:hypothetical protein
MELAEIFGSCLLVSFVFNVVSLNFWYRSHKDWSNWEDVKIVHNHIDNLTYMLQTRVHKDGRRVYRRAAIDMYVPTTSIQIDDTKRKIEGPY